MDITPILFLIFVVLVVIVLLMLRQIAIEKPGPRRSTFRHVKH
jgi:hypothetical protein